jgi:hypothetical protein
LSKPKSGKFFTEEEVMEEETRSKIPLKKFDPKTVVLRVKRKVHGGSTISVLTTKRRIAAPMERNKKMKSRRRNKIAAASRKKNR